MPTLIEPGATSHPKADCPICRQSWALTLDDRWVIALNGEGKKTRPVDANGFFSCDHPPVAQDVLFRLHRLKVPDAC